MHAAPDKMNFNPNTCPLCGGPNACQLASPDASPAPCWCCRVEPDTQVLKRVPPEYRHRSCLCRNCLEKTPAG